MKKNIKKSKRNNSRNTLCINNEYIERKDKIASFFFSKQYKGPITKKELAGIFNIHKYNLNILENILRDLSDEGKITSDMTRRYMPVTKENIYECIFDYKNEKFGFAICKDKTKEDIYIPESGMNTAMNGDEISVIIDKSINYGNHRKVGKIVAITKRKVNKVVGSVYTVGDNTFVQSIDSRVPSIYIDKIDVEDKSLIKNSLVEVEITSYPNRRTNFTGNIIRIICEKDEIDAYVKGLYIAYDLDKKMTFNKEIIKELENITTEVDPKDLVGRVDKTSENIYTIDSEDAKDLDDAISIKKREDGTYDLSVHIADVSHYVKDGTNLDKEAATRATSIYIPGSVIPMLPKELSNGICSLSEGKLRLTLSIDMHIDKEGEVVKHNIYKAYIKSKKKMTYEKVYKCINKSDENVTEEYKPFLKDIDNMLELSKILNKKRINMGSILFDIPETKVELNEDGSVKDIKPYEITVANKIIEEFMLVTNMVVAEKFLFLSAPFIYRIHEKPDEEKLNGLNEILNNYGKRIKSVKKIHPKVLADILAEFESEEEKTVISTIALRTLKLAKYSSECLGHFGLAFKYYCHFTSPIRRYPDLFIHRVISDYISGNYLLPENKQSRYAKQSIIYADISTEKEKESTKIERDFDDLYMAMFMKNKIGEEFVATVSSITGFGMFVKLENTVEGLIHIANLKGYYTFDEKRYLLIGKERTYKIGDKVNVKLIRVDVKSKQIDFDII